MKSVGKRNDESGRESGFGATGSSVKTVPGDESLEESEEHTVEGPKHTEHEDGEKTASTTGLSTGGVYTARFTGFITLIGFLIGLGIFTFNVGAIIAAGALLIFLFAGLLQAPANPKDDLNVHYDITPTSPRPGGSIEVTVEIENTGEETYTDIRLVDSVPDRLRVTNGSARAARTLRPDQTLTLEYEVMAQRGTYAFGPIVIRTRTLMGSAWQQVAITPTENTEVRCAVRADDIPIEDEANEYIGRLLGETGGDGVEFYATREYHRGDPPSRINWRQLAKEDDLSTITYREHQASNITVIADARMCSRVSAVPGSPSATLLSMYAGYQLTTSLTADGHYVGMVVPGITPGKSNGNVKSPFPYLKFEHGRGAEQQRRAFNVLNHVDSVIEETDYSTDSTAPLREVGSQGFTTQTATPELFDSTRSPTTVNDFIHTLTTWADADAQFMFITPLLDNGSQRLSTQLHNMGFSVVVISPDVTTTPEDIGAESSQQRYQENQEIPEYNNNHQHTPIEEEQAYSLDPTDPSITQTPRRLRRLHRAIRIESLRKYGVTVIDWNPSEPLAACCERQTLPSEN